MNKLVFFLFFVITFISCDLIPREKLLIARQDARLSFSTTHETEINDIIARLNTTLMNITVDQATIHASPPIALELILRGFDASYAMDYDVCAQTLTFFISNPPELTLREIGNYIKYCEYIDRNGLCVEKEYGVHHFSSRAEFGDKYTASRFYTMRPETECANSF